MEDSILRGHLQQLDIPPESVGASLLLPLLQVTWAYGAFDEAARTQIVDLAQQLGLSESGLAMVAHWLDLDPASPEVTLAHRVLGEAIQRSGDVHLGTEGRLDSCVQVASVLASVLDTELPPFGPDQLSVLVRINAICEACSVGELDGDEDDPSTKTFIDPSLMMEASVTFRGTGEFGEAHVVPVMHGFEGQRIPIVGELKLGRAANNHVRINDDGLVSRFHCRIVFENGAYYLYDNESTNGTLVDDEPAKHLRLLGGEMIGIGESRFRFELTEPTN